MKEICIRIYTKKHLADGPVADREGLGWRSSYNKIGCFTLLSYNDNTCMFYRLVHSILLLAAFAGTGKVRAQEEGLASYYHNRFHGRKAASGQTHDIGELVAAHRTHPFGTFLRVTNLSNMKRVIVCVTDRGPFRKGRIIDVSVGAAELLDFKKKGLARVRVEVVPSKTDLSHLDLLVPQPSFLEVDHLRVELPDRINLKK